MMYYRESVIAKELIKSANIDIVDREKKSMASSLAREFVNKDTKDTIIAISFEEEWSTKEYIGNAYKIRATAQEINVRYR